MKIQRIFGNLQTVRYWKGQAYRLIGWYEDETEALSIAKKLRGSKVVLNDRYYGVYHKV